MAYCEPVEDRTVVFDLCNFTVLCNQLVEVLPKIKAARNFKVKVFYFELGMA